MSDSGCAGMVTAELASPHGRNVPMRPHQHPEDCWNHA